MKRGHFNRRGSRAPLLAAAAGISVAMAAPAAAQDQPIAPPIEQGRVGPWAGPAGAERPASQTPQAFGIAPRAEARDVAIHIAGYADAGVAISDRESGSGTTFVSGTFNPALYVQYRNLLLVESEVEIAVDQDGETELELEFAQFDLLLHDNVTLVLGKFLSPVGQFQERLHPSWINRLADAPAGFGHGGVQPTAEIGVQLRGGVPLGRTRLTYAVSVGNGPRIDGGGEMMSEGFGGDDNGNKALSGRIGFLPLPYVEFGASMLRAKVRGPAGEGEAEEMGSGAGSPITAASVGGGTIEFPATDVDYRIWGLDAAYTRGPWDVRFEYLRGKRDAITAPGHRGEIEEVLPTLRMTAWYAQLAYRLSGITRHPVLGNFEPVVRYGEYRVSGLEELEEEAAEERVDFGLNYWLAPSMVLHGAVQRRNFTGRHEGEANRDTRILLQLAYGF